MLMMSRGINVRSLVVKGCKRQNIDYVKGYASSG